MLDFYVKARIRFSLRDKRLFEITEVEITRVDCITLENGFDNNVLFRLVASAAEMLKILIIKYNASIAVSLKTLKFRTIFLSLVSVPGRRLLIYFTALQLDVFYFVRPVIFQ